MEERKKFRPTGVNDFVGITMDFETGGLPSAKVPFRDIAITQVAVNSFRLSDMEMMDRMVLYVYPYHKIPQKKLKKKEEEIREELMEYSQEALNFTGITMSMLKEKGEDIQVVGRKVLDFINDSVIARTKTGLPIKQYKPIFLGQNFPFDAQFWAQLMERSGLEAEASKIISGTTDYWGNFQPHYIDTLQLSKLAFCHDESFTSYSLGNVANRIGLPLYDAHDAQADTDATYNVLAYYVSKMRGSGGADMGDSSFFEQEKDRLEFKI